jgi:hypothetical protein
MAPLLRPFSPDYAAILQRAGANAKWLVHPDLTIVQIGDSDPNLTDRYRDRLIMPNGDSNCKSISSYAQSPACYLLRHFEDTGYVVVRSDWAVPTENASMLFVQGGLLNRAHRDYDDLTFEWFDRGRKILSDSGKYTVVPGEWRDYFNSTRAQHRRG